uniref:Prepronociceptin n=1 Tax=Spermophilus dauricus TaxID=99837 RepID=A0A8C9PUY2_SPEDA
MKIMLCDLLLLSLLSSVFSSCPRDCLTCREKLHPALDGFNLEVVSPALLEAASDHFHSCCWSPHSSLARAPWQLSPADPEHVTAALYQPRASEMQHLKRMPRVRSLFQAQKETEPGVDEAGEAEQKQLQKRFGGFTGPCFLFLQGNGCRVQNGHVLQVKTGSWSLVFIHRHPNLACV